MHEVVFAPEALADLLDLYDTIAKNGGGERAIAYVERIEAACLRLRTFPERGTRWDDIRPGLRVIGFGRRVAIAFHVGAERVTIDRILYGGRDLGAAFPVICASPPVPRATGSVLKASGRPRRR